VRLLLDEMLSPAIARELRERGHDVLAMAEHPGWAALSDPEVVAVARTERRAIVTNNLGDYRPLHADAITPGGPGHFGMVFMPGSYRRTRADTGRIISALEAKLTEYPGDEDLANGECWAVTAGVPSSKGIRLHGCAAGRPRFGRVRGLRQARVERAGAVEPLPVRHKIFIF
jgi:hypothetical protein